MSLEAAAVFLAALVLPCLYAAWSDLKSLTIPNRVVLLCGAIYLVTGPFVLPFEEFLWRFLPAAIVLVAGFLLNMTGQFGAGDAKFATVMVLFVARVDLPTILWIYAVVALLAVLVVWLVKLAAPGLAATSGWLSLKETRRFPLGLPLALTLLIYLALVVRHNLLTTAG